MNEPTRLPFRPRLATGRETDDWARTATTAELEARRIDYGLKPLTKADIDRAVAGEWGPFDGNDAA